MSGNLLSFVDTIDTSLRKHNFAIDDLGLCASSATHFNCNVDINLATCLILQSMRITNVVQSQILHYCHLLLCSLAWRLQTYTKWPAFWYLCCVALRCDIRALPRANERFRNPQAERWPNFYAVDHCSTSTLSGGLLSLPRERIRSDNGVETCTYAVS